MLDQRAFEVAALCGAGPRLSAEIDVTAAHLQALVERWGPDAGEDAAPKQLARELQGTVPVIAGAELTTAIAYRWKTQINENAGLPAFSAELPELDHNEIAGWLGTGELGPFSAIFLDDCDFHPRLRACGSGLTQTLHRALRARSRASSKTQVEARRRARARLLAGAVR